MNHTAEEALQDVARERLPEADEVAAYLRARPDFFEQYPELLDTLRLPHVHRGTVSLVERQLERLRERLAREQRRLRELIENGRQNDHTQARLHRLTLDLMRAQRPAEAIEALHRSLTEDFRVAAVALRLRHAAPADLPGWVGSLDAQGSRLAEVERVLDRHRAWCGEVGGAVRDWLFGTGSGVRSAALLPVGAAAEYGLLAIGSTDPLAYNKAMNTHYLDRLASLLGACLSRWLVPAEVSRA